MTEFYYLMLIYTFTLFTFLAYLLYLRVYHLGKLTDIKVKMTINLNFYVFLFYLSFFVISLLLSCYLYLLDLGGTAIGRILVETLADDYNAPCDDPNVGQASRNNELACHKDVSANSPSEPKEPRDGSFGYTMHSLREYLSNWSLEFTKNSILKASENNLVHRNNEMLQNTVNEFVSDRSVLAETLDFERSRAPWMYAGARVPEENKPKIFAVVDALAFRGTYDGRASAGNVKVAYNTYEGVAMSMAFSTNKFGQALAVPLNDPVEIARAADLLGYRPDEICDSQRQIAFPPREPIIETIGNLLGKSSHSAPPSPTSARNTHNPF